MRLAVGLPLLLLLAPFAPAVHASASFTTTDPVQVTAVAVAQLPDGTLVGASSTVSVTVATPGSGHVFVDTRPLAQVDMQGSARLAARVASAVTGLPEREHDFFFVLRSPSAIVGGPSAGAVMTLAAVAALENAHLFPGEPAWRVARDIAATGTINPDGTIGPVGGIPQKAQAARDAGARLFLVPVGQGNYTEVSAAFGGPATPLNMSSYCADELRITCREVGRITELVRLATGHELRRPAGETPGTRSYADVLGPQARAMVDEAASRLERLEGSVASADLTDAQRTFLDDVLNETGPLLARARDALAVERYYSATSLTFQVNRFAALADGLLRYFVSGLDPATVDARIDEAAIWVGRAADRARGADVSGVNDLLAVGAAQERVSQAEGLLARAREAARAGAEFTDVEAALDDAGFAIERARTVLWWANLTRAFGDGPPLSASQRELAEEFLDVTDETVQYVAVVADPASQNLAQAARTLALARADIERGFYSGALVEAAEAQVFATSALEEGIDPTARMGAARDEAADAIADARRAGAEPVLAVSLFEFGGDNEGSELGLSFYRQARVLAGMTVFLAAAPGEPAESVFVGAPAALEALGPTPSEALRTVAAGYFVLGAALVLVLVIVAGALRRR